MTVISGVEGERASMGRRSSYERYETGLPHEDVVLERGPMPGLVGIL